MAIKRKMKVEVYLSSYGNMHLTGDAAQSFLAAWQAYMSGQNTNIKGASFDVTESYGEPTTMWVNFECLCQVIVRQTEEEEIPDTPCEQIDCIPDYPAPPAPEPEPDPEEGE